MNILPASFADRKICWVFERDMLSLKDRVWLLGVLLYPKKVELEEANLGVRDELLSFTHVLDSFGST